MRFPFVALLSAAAMVAILLACSAADSRSQAEVDAPVPEFTGEVQLERVSTKVPFPRGLVMVDGSLYALCRGRVRDYGGVTAEIDDQAGTLYAVDPEVVETVEPGAPVSQRVRDNGRVVAQPTDPPFKLWDRAADPPSSDRETDRPYCALRHDPASNNLFVCAFAGVDKPASATSTFSKNLTDALLRYDLRTGTWHEVERHDIEKGGLYPHHNPARREPPHGWLNGPDNCLVVGRWLYAVAKDNSVLVRYDLAPIAADPDAGHPPSFWVLGVEIALRGGGTRRFEGHSMLAQRDGWLYLGFRTTSEIVRFRLDDQGLPVEPIQAEIVALFDPYDPEKRRSANLTDMDFAPDGSLVVISASPARLYRFLPDPDRVYDARGGAKKPWADLAVLTGNPKMKSENVLVAEDGRVYVTSGDAYEFHHGAGGVIWRVSEAATP